MLKAFVYGQLPLVGEPGGFVGLNQEMRKTWFKAKAGGRCWVLEPRDPADHTEPEAKDEARELIGQINNRQEALEQTRMKLEGLQKLLYDTWWQLNAKMKSPGPEPADLNTIEHQIEALKTGALAQQIKQKQIDAGTIEQDIEKKFKAMVSAEVTDKPPDPGVKPKPASGPTDRPLKQFAEFVDQIARRLLLSQSLLDFNSQLQMRGTQLSILPEDEELAELIGEQYQNQPLASPPDPIEGQGMRQGHFKINRLEVYDGFDQCLVLVGPGGPIDAEMFAPVRDNNLTPGAKAADSSQLIELKPRITEYTRLRFDFLPAREPRPEDDSSRTPIYDDNPVAGWFLYNHLDRSLVLFDCPTV